MNELLNNFIHRHFHDPGKKMKDLAVAYLLLSLILSVFAAVIMVIAALFDFPYLAYLFTAAPFVVIITYAAVWPSALVLYGFGTIVEKLSQDTGKVSEAKPTPKGKPAPLVKKMEDAPPAHQWRCPDCGSMINQTPCPYCQGKIDKADLEQDETSWTCPKCGRKNLKSRTNCWSCDFTM